MRLLLLFFKRYYGASKMEIVITELGSTDMTSKQGPLDPGFTLAGSTAIKSHYVVSELWMVLQHRFTF